MGLDPHDPSVRKLLASRKGKSGASLLEEYEKSVLANSHPPALKNLSSGQETSSLTAPVRRNKYRNTRFEKNGEKWDSEWEYQCWLVLKSLEKKRVIFNLQRQVKYEFWVNGVYIAKVILDFAFDFQKSPHIMRSFPKSPWYGARLKGERWTPSIVADAKHPETAKMQRWKWQINLMRALYLYDVKVFYKGITDVVKEVYFLREKS